MNRLSIEKKISIIVFTTAILGIIAEFVPYSKFIGGLSNYWIISVISKFISCLKLTFFGSRLFEIYNFDTGANTNILNLILYSILLLGGILFLFKKLNETRLIRFFYAVVLINSIAAILLTIISVPILAKDHSIKVYWMLLTLIPYIFWVYVSYWTISKIHTTKTFEVVEAESNNGSDNKIYIEASIWQRFFHLVIDTMFIFLIFSPFILVLKESFIEGYTSSATDKAILYIMLIIFRLIYYPFWETLFGATPAKFLTETRVLNENGTRIGLKKALTRTLSRFIPFEPFSFLGAQGWHDGITKTQVVTERRTGIYGGKFFLIIPLFLVIGLGWYFGKEMYDHHKTYVHYKGTYDRNIGQIEKALKNLTSDYIIKIKDIDNYGDLPYLKVEMVKDDKVLVTLIPKDRDSYFDQSYKEQRYYSKFKSNLNQKVIMKSSLERAYTPDYDDHKKNNKKSADIMDDGKNYEIESIETMYAPFFEEGGFSSLRENVLSISIKNKSWPADIVKIENIKGALDWQVTLPLRINPDNESTLMAVNCVRGQKYKVKFVVQDSLKRQHTYIFAGKNLDHQLFKE